MVNTVSHEKINLAKHHHEHSIFKTKLYNSYNRHH